MRRLLRSIGYAAGGLLPEPLLRAFARRAIGERNVALCLHRVAIRRPGEWLSECAIAPAELDALIAFMRSLRPGVGGWLTVSFDDGYEDAARYILSRAPWLQDVEWLFFVCPRRLEQQVGFRWDLVEHRLRCGEAVDPDGLMWAPPDVSGEHAREDLRAVAALPRYRLADLALCRELQRLPNVELGNHTNGHFRQTLLSPEQVEEECQASARDFTRLFGPQEHFAFPFGVPRLDFDDRHVAALRAQGSRFLIWSTESRPYAPSERRPGAVLPRFAIEGSSWRRAAHLIALRALRSRLRGPLFGSALSHRTGVQDCRPLHRV